MRQKHNVLLIVSLAFLTTIVFVQDIVAKSYSTEQVNKLLAKFQQEIKQKGYHYTVDRTSVIGYSVDELCKLDIGKEQLCLSPPEPKSTFLQKSLALPSVFDWNEQGKCSPIKDQGKCGSCWAFASIGSYECALEIFKNVEVKLSEQYLVSCSPDGSGCDGGSCAFRSMTAGTPLDSCAPYGGSQTGSQCAKFYPIQSRFSIESSVSSLKQAIYNHGGVYATVAATDDFIAYKNGVFDNNDTAAQTNHAIVLVGWDDTKQAWRLRNSWGTGWGENGYMWIAYNCLKVGLYAQYAIPAGKNSLVAAPTNLTATVTSLSQINIAWQNNDLSVGGFYIERKSESENYTQIAKVAKNVLTYSSFELTANTKYSYRVRAIVGKLFSDYSNEATATTQQISAPVNVKAEVVSPSKINLFWQEPISPVIINGYYIECKSGSHNYTQIAMVPQDVKSVLISSLAPNTVYNYRVRSYSNPFYSSYSNEVSVTTTQNSVPIISLPPVIGTVRTRNLTVIDARGNCIVRTTITDQRTANDIPLLFHLAPGFYIARITDGSSITRQRFVVAGERVTRIKTR